MKILLLVDWTYPCDHQFLTNVYATNFVDRGHDVTWVMRPDNSDQQTIEHDTWNGSDVYVLPNSAFDPVRNYLRHRVGRITNNALFSTGIEFDNFDIVHVRNDLPMGLAAAYLADTYDLAFTHQISHLKAESLIEAHQQGFESRTSWIKGHLGKQLRRRVSEVADLVLPISEAMKAYLVQSGYETPMEVLPTGTEIIDEIPDEESFKTKYDVESDYVLLYMGTMSPLRRLEFLFDVLREVNETYDVELLMVGGRSVEPRERLRRLASEAGVSSKVTFTGWIADRDEIRRAIATVDIGVSPVPTDSILRTNAPIKTLEYLSLGTPVVASSTPDQKSVLENSGGGLAVDHRVDEFSDAIDWLFSSPETLRRMEQQGRDYIRENRNFEVLTDYVEQTYENMINTKPYF